MSEQTVSATEMRDKFAELLEQVENGRILVHKHGQSRAYLISVRELCSLEETIAVLENTDLARGIQRSLEDLRKGNLEDANDVFAELDAEFGR